MVGLYLASISKNECLKRKLLKIKWKNSTKPELLKMLADYPIISTIINSEEQYKTLKITPTFPIRFQFNFEEHQN